MPIKTVILYRDMGNSVLLDLFLFLVTNQLTDQQKST